MLSSVVQRDQPNVSLGKSLAGLLFAASCSTLLCSLKSGYCPEHGGHIVLVFALSEASEH